MTAVPCTQCDCIDVVPDDARRAEPTDPCVCGHAISSHESACPACGAQIEGLDVACRRCGALVGDEIERRSLEHRSGLAFASFVTSLAPILFPIAIALGILALRSIRSNPMATGRGLAITGIVIGSCWLVLAVVSAFLA